MSTGNEIRKINTTHKTDFYKMYIGIIACIGLILYNIIHFLMNDFDTQAIISLIFDLSLLLIIAVLLVLFVNRGFCWIYIENGMLKRKGLLFGFRKEVKISDIKKVVTYKLNYYIIEKNEELEDPLQFQECINFIKHYDDHDEFLNSFWNGAIEDYYDIKNAE